MTNQFCRLLQADAESARITFTYRFRVEIGFIGESEVDNATLAGVHRPKVKRRARRTNAVGGVARHHAQLGLARGAEVINVTDESLTVREGTAVYLVDEVFERAQQLAALGA